MIEGFGAVPVVDAKDKLLGIVSEHDLLAALDDGKERASDLIRVPVVDADDKLVGIIARRDVLRAYLASGVARR